MYSKLIKKSFQSNGTILVFYYFVVLHTQLNKPKFMRRHSSEGWFLAISGRFRLNL